MSVEAVLVRPIQWQSLSDIDDVRPIDDTDAPVLDDIRAVLEKHGCLDRFGVALLHRHFDVADSELMLETTDVTAREHWVRPVRRAELAAKGLTTQSTIIRFMRPARCRIAAALPTATDTRVGTAISRLLTSPAHPNPPSPTSS